MKNIIHMLVFNVQREREFWNLILEYIKNNVTTTLLIAPFNFILGYILAELICSLLIQSFLLIKKYI